jgi:DNA-directed RNA polymerase specialized sigma24 family protein
MSEMEESLKRLEAKLDVLVKMLAYRVIDGQQSVAGKAVILRQCGLPLKEIAAICGTTTNTIGVSLTKAKRSAKRAKKKNLLS